MNRLQLRSLVRLVHADAGVGTDADLLARYLRDGDDAAFTALVHRYGRLVWAVCRHQTRSDADAEDAFHATFLVLARNAGSVRKTAALGAWLHGVAYRVCAKARKAAAARAARERVVSRAEANRDIPDSAWDRAIAAVHDELARLPETLRVPFVLCCLEGKGTTAAAAQLGWKLGTFSGRLTRAKDLLLARLEARGVSVGAVAAVTVGAAAAPAAVADRLPALVAPGAAIPKTIHLLTQGVIEMSLNRAKLLAAGLIVACGLGTGVGSHWAARADDPKPAKNTKPDKTPATVADLFELMQTKPDDVTADMLFDLINRQPKGETYVAATKKWEYDFVIVSEMGPIKFVTFLQDRENRGWEFNGQVTINHDGKPGASAWMFRRPAKAVAVQTTANLADALTKHYQGRYLDAAADLARGDAAQERIKQLEAEIARLKGQGASNSTTLTPIASRQRR